MTNSPYIPERKQRGPDYEVAPSGCWNWIKGLGPTGYGRLFVKGQRWAAHRWYFLTHVGPIPDGYEVHHTCNNRICVNPEHLEALSPREHRRRHGTSTFLGVSWSICEEAWIARIWRDGERKFIGWFKTKELAAAAIEEAGGYGD